MPRTPKWFRRLFGQDLYRPADVRIGRDLGFDGDVADVPITDWHRIEAIEGALTANERLTA
jgi:hypothetical protein